MPADSLEQIVSLCKRRGFVYPGSAVYGGFSSSWDYGPLGVELKNNIKRQWWLSTVQLRDDVEGIDCALIMNPKVWVHSGHVGTFSDPLVDNRKTKKRYRLDHLLEAQSEDFISRLVAYMSTHFKMLYDIEVQRLGSSVGLATFASETDTNNWSETDWEIEIQNRPEFKKLLESKLAVLHRKIEAAVHGVDLLDAEKLSDENFTSIVEGELKSHRSVQEVRIEAITFALLHESDAHSERHLALVPPIDPETGEPGDWTAPRQFNLMFDTHIGPIKDDDHKAYLRPETAQGMFVNFKNVLDTMRRRLPFGIAQVGRSFRNEITPGNFIFRQREFEQMEIEYFCHPDEAEAKFHHWIDWRMNWWKGLGVNSERLRLREHAKDELAHYAAACSDVEYLFPGSLGWNELEGIANRTCYDLTAHSKDNDAIKQARERFGMEPNTDSIESLTYYDEKSKTHLVPYVIEPAAGVDRAFLVFLCDAYCEEWVSAPSEADAKAVGDALSAFLKSVDKNKELGDEKKQAILAAGQQIADAIGYQALSGIPALLAMPGADMIELGKKLRGQAERVIDACCRTVLKLDPRLSPIKVAVFPLKKNHEGIVAKAREILATLKPHMKAVYDDTGAIGKLYRRQDEIGTPYCITVDFQSLEDGTVTIRHRDTMEQERVAAGGLKGWLAERVG